MLNTSANAGVSFKKLAKTYQLCVYCVKNSLPQLLHAFPLQTSVRKNNPIASGNACRVKEKVPPRPYLEPLHVLHLCRLSGGHAGVEEGGGDGDAQRLGRHPGLGLLAVAVDDAEGAEQEHQKVLRVGRQGQEDPGRKNRGEIRNGFLGRKDLYLLSPKKILFVEGLSWISRFKRGP